MNPFKFTQQNLISLVDKLQQRVVEQDQAINAVANAVMKSRIGLRNPQQPIGSFLFVGPTAVGKTELAKAIAEQLFDNEDSLISFYMFGYMDQQRLVAQLIGTPTGYVGHDEGGQSTGAVSRRQRCVILLEKLENANSTVLNTLSRVLDDGRLTDGQGHIVDLTNTVIVMTTNLGAMYLLKGLKGKRTMESAKELVMQEVRKHFKPDFLDRLDEIVVFDLLSHDQLRKVARLQLKDVAIRFAKRDIALDVTEEALDVILAESCDPKYGARSTGRWLENEVVTELSKMILRDEIDKNSIVYIDAAYNRKELTYRVEKNKTYEC